MPVEFAFHCCDTWLRTKKKYFRGSTVVIGREKFRVIERHWDRNEKHYAHRLSVISQTRFPK